MSSHVEPNRPARTRWTRALGWSTGALYLPQLLPFVLGPLAECDHCVRAYLGLFPIVPGISVARAVQDDSWRVVAVLATVLFLGIATASMRALGPLGRRWLAAAVALLAFFNAMGLSVLLRT